MLEHVQIHDTGNGRLPEHMDDQVTWHGAQNIRFYTPEFFIVGIR
jgi:hypothetical protein